MTNRLTITIELPDGVVPDVQYSSAPPIVQEVPGQDFTTLPVQMDEPQCKVHLSPMKRGRDGFFCPKRLKNGAWCTETYP